MNISQAIAIFTLAQLFGQDAHTRPLSQLMDDPSFDLAQRIGVMSLYYLANGAEILQQTTNTFAATSTTQPERVVYLKKPEDAAAGILRLTDRSQFPAALNGFWALSHCFQHIGDPLNRSALDLPAQTHEAPDTAAPPSATTADLLRALASLRLVVSLEAEPEQ